MGQKRSVAGTLSQGPKNNKLSVSNLIGSVFVVKDPHPVNEPAKYVVQFLNVFKQVVPFYGMPLPL